MRITYRCLVTFCAILALASVAPTIADAQKGSNVERRIKFARGKTSTTVKGVIPDRLTTHEYLVGASAGQRLTVRLSSPRSDVGICVVYPVGTETPENACGRSYTATLPVDGDYSIIVDSKRDNISYSLFVSVQ